MARKKADDAEADTAQSNTSADDAAQCFIEIQEINSAVARLGQKKATTFTRFANMGVDTDAVKDCLKLAKDEDAPERVKRMVDMARILKIIPVEVDANGQTSALFIVRPDAATLSARKDEALSLHRAFWQGHDAGYDGGERNANPYDPGTSLHVDWDKGFSDGVEDLGAKQPGVEKAPTETRPRTGRAATNPPETALARDEAAYRGQAAN